MLGAVSTDAIAKPAPLLILKSFAGHEKTKKARVSIKACGFKIRVCSHIRQGPGQKPGEAR